VKRFDFPLERVRRWRREQASVEELKLQQFRSELDRVEASKREIEADAARSAQQVFAQASIEPLELTSLESYRLHLRQRTRELENLERQFEARVVEQRNRVIEARRQFELLDHLHDKAFGEWRAAADKEYEDMASELFLAKSTRNR
jgi:flagellar export protein FliJ